MQPDISKLEAICGPVSRETVCDLNVFVEFFEKWNTSINLASTRSVDDLWHRHIIDSAQIVPLIATDATLIDLGSGGGFPGLVAAILKRQCKIHLVESNRKKAAFLQAVVGRLALGTRIHAIRAEAVSIPCADYVSCRALAPLSTLFDVGEKWLAKGATALFLKGRDYRVEVEQISDSWSFDLIEHQSITESRSAVLEFRNVVRQAV